MKKLYIKFGEPLPEEDQIYVYEAIVDENLVRILIPALSYPTCMNISRDIDQGAYLVEGRYVGKEKYGQHILRDYKVVSKLTFDKENENYIYNDKIEPPKPKIEAQKEFVIEKPNMSKIFEKKNLTTSAKESIDESKFIKDDTATAIIGQNIGKALGLIFFRK